MACALGGVTWGPASLQHRFSEATRYSGGRFPLPRSQHQSGPEPGPLPPNPRLFVLEEGPGIREVPLYSPAPAQEMRVNLLSENRRGPEPPVFVLAEKSRPQAVSLPESFSPGLPSIPDLPQPAGAGDF